ncbi:MAG: TetR/AcrR family transcriptional regulator [Pseudooceanicola sp.]
MAEQSDSKASSDKADRTLEEAEITNVQNSSLVQSRREQICDAALELFLEKGFASTTIRDICARSGVNQASIYDYIANKNDILRRLLNQLWFRKDVVGLPDVLGDGTLSLEEAFARYYRDSWNAKRKGTLLVYRSVPHMLEEDRKAMRARDVGLIAALAAELRKRAGREVDDTEVEILANVLIFLSAFGPMRDWLHKDAPNETIVRAVASGAAAMTRSLLGEPEGAKRGFDT